MIWHTNNPEALGYLPDFLSESDPRSASEQFHANYPFGGWAPFQGFKMNKDGSISYPGDPTLHPFAETILRDETIRVYPSAWVAVIQKDGSFEIARMD